MYLFYSGTAVGATCLPHLDWCTRDLVPGLQGLLLPLQPATATLPCSLFSSHKGRMPGLSRSSFTLTLVPHMYLESSFLSLAMAGSFLSVKSLIRCHLLREAFLPLDQKSPPYLLLVPPPLSSSPVPCFLNSMTSEIIC